MKDKSFRIIHFIAFVGLLYASYLLLLLSLPYIHFQPNIEFLQTKQLIYHISVWRWSFYIHVFTSPVVILSGILQFIPAVIRKFPRGHRISGYIYVIVTICITGPAAFIMSLYANGSYPAQFSFTLLSILWVVLTFFAVHYARKGRFDQHTKWALRSFALTLSAVTLRVYAYLFDVLNIDLGPKETYIILSYISWIPNLIIAEIAIRSGYTKRLLRSATS